MKKQERLLSLVDIFYELKGTASGGISMPSLVKYKKEHARRGGLLERFVRGTDFEEKTGNPRHPRRIRFVAEAIPIFMKCKRDGEAKRGRPRKERKG